MVLVNKLPTSTHTLGSWSGTPHVALADGNTATGSLNGVLNDDLLMEFADVTETSSGALLSGLTLKSAWDNVSAVADGSSALRARTAAGVLSSSTTHSPGAGISLFNYAGFIASFVTVGDFNGGQFGGTQINFAVNPLRFQELNADVDFIPPGGSFAVFAGGLVGAVTLLQLGQMAALARAIYRQRRLLVKPDEYSTMFRELREARYSRYFDLGAA